MRDLSIKKKLVMVVFSLILGFMIVLLLLNVFFLEDFFIYTLKEVFIEEATEINEVYHNDPKNLLNTLKEHNNINGYKYVIVDAEGFIMLSSVPEFDENNKMALAKHQFNIISDYKEEITTKKYKYLVLKHPKKEQDQIVIMRYLTSNKTLVISVQLDEIRRNADIANKFFLITGCIMIVLILIVSYILSKKIVKPIIDINHQTAKIANLDFNVSLNYDSKDEIGQLAHSISSISKVLDQKIQDLYQANSLLKNDMISQRQFLASIAHEFKSPIGIIKGYTESIKLNYYETEEEKQDYLNYVLDESDRLNNLVEDIVLLAKLDKRDFKLDISDVDFSNTVLHSLDKYTNLMKSKGLHVETAIKSDLFISGDAVRIEQIVDNMLSNANRYTTENGHIKVSLESVESKAVLSIENTCHEIDKIDLSSLIKPFYRLEESRSRETGGHGLGLTIVNGLVDAHHGETKLSYAEGKFIIKTTFNLLNER